MPIKSDNTRRSAVDPTAPRVLHAQKILMRDGVFLNALVFVPRETDSPVPVVMQMTPYGIDAFYGTGRRFTERGLALALVDCRGRGNSDGEFEMFETDINDTVDAIDWLAGQTWCDGQVAMYGGSYSGLNQWTAAKSGHPALKGIAPWGAGYPGVDVPPGGIPFIGHIGWYALTAGRDTKWQLAADSAYWINELAGLYRRHGSAAELARQCGITRPTFERVLRDPFYAMRAMTFLPTEQDLARIDIPILSSTGHYDSTHAGTLYHFLQHERFGTPSGRQKHTLVIGPWHHAGMNGGGVVGALEFGPQARIDIGSIRLDWYRWIFGLGEKPSFFTHRVMYYIAGAEEWHGSDSIEQTSVSAKSFYLDGAPGGGHDVYHAGSLRDSPIEAPPDRYVSDPFDDRIIELELGLRDLPRPQKPDTSIVYPDPVRGLHFQIAGEDPTDPAFALNVFGQGLIYQSEPLEHDLEIAGIPELDLWLTLSAPDSDVVALVYEILADESQSILLWSNLLRLRYRDSWREPRLASPGEPLRASFYVPRFMSRRLRRGSRIRLVIRAPGSIYFQKNLQSGKPVHEERPEDARVCEVLVHHDRGRQTVLRLPIAKARMGAV